MENINEDRILARASYVVNDVLRTRFNLPEDYDLEYTTSIEEVCKNDIHTFEHALLDIHEILKIEVEYEVFTGFERFKTIGNLVDYVCVQIEEKLEREGEQGWV